MNFDAYKKASELLMEIFFKLSNLNVIEFKYSKVISLKKLIQ